MKVTVCSTITYYYDVELPEWMGEKDENRNLIHKQFFIDACYELTGEGAINLKGLLEWFTDEKQSTGIFQRLFNDGERIVLAIVYSSPVCKVYLLMERSPLHRLFGRECILITRSYIGEIKCE
jgi:hypothetical protein